MSTGRSHTGRPARALHAEAGRRAASSATGEVGFVIAGIKEIDGAPVGDTITLENRAGAPRRCRASSRSSRGCSPACSRSTPRTTRSFRDALAKLRLNDSALHYEPEVSGALGFGFRCGFLGLLHMDIVQERLEREYDLDLITTAPTVVYEVLRTDGDGRIRRQPGEAAAASNEIEEIREPIIIANILVPPDYVGAVLKLCNDKRGVQKKMQYLGTQVSLQYELPLAEVVLDFFDRLKSVEPRLRLVRLRVQPLPGGAAGQARHPDQRRQGRCAVDHRAPRQRLSARPRAGRQDAGADPAPDVRRRGAGGDRQRRSSRAPRVKALRKNVLAKCYGGDITRKRKLLEKQKEGKKRMKQVGQVEIPQEAFLAEQYVNERCPQLATTYC